MNKIHNQSNVRCADTDGHNMWWHPLKCVEPNKVVVSSSFSINSVCFIFRIKNDQDYNCKRIKYKEKIQ
jgi:hypothetical protein